MKRNFRLQHTALVLALAAAYPIVGHSAAGTAQFASGEVTYKRGSAAPAALTKGTTLESGDAITTGARGIAQVKFSDGGYVAIQPNSQFDITRYADNGNAQQDSFLVNLARGGMRAITGLIGKRNTANYKVTTSTATVGIRGSSFTLAYGPNGEIIVTTEQDGIEVCTTAGCTGLTAGESAIVTNPNAEPSRTNTTTTMPLVPYRQDPQVAGNQANPDGSPAILDAQLTGAYDMAFAWSGNDGEGFSRGVWFDGQLHFGANGAPIKYTYTEGSDEGGLFAADDAVTVFTTRGTLANNDLMVLGLWTSATEEDRWTNYSGGSSSEIYGNYSPLAFAAGQVTPEANIAAMNMTATYTLSAATPVLVNYGYGNGTLNSATLDVGFFSGSNQGTLNMNITVPHEAGTSANYALSGSVSGEGSYFSGSVSTGSSYGPALAAVITDSYAYASVRGFFGGNSAQWAGLSYRGYAQGEGESYYYYDFGGAAILGQTSTTAYGTVQGVSGFGVETGYPGYANWPHYEYMVLSSTGGVVDQLSHPWVTGSAVGAAQEIASVTVDGGKVSIGLWENSIWQYYDGYSYNVENYVFVAGPSTSNDYVNSLNQTATYSLTNGVKSDVYSTNGGTLGTLDSATLSVNFGGGSNTGALGLSFTLGGSYGGTSTFSGTVSGQGSYFSGWGSLQGTAAANGYLDVSGHFYGTSAEYAGLSYGSYWRNGENFYGSAILSQDASVVEPVVPEAGTYSTLASFAAWSSHSPGTDELPATTEHQFAAGPFLSAISAGEGSFSASSTVNGGFDSAGSAANGDFIGWGKWESASVTYSGGSTTASNVHYVVGIPTTSTQFSALSGTASYSVTGATAPTASNGATGELTAAQLQVNFGASTVSATVTTKFDGNYFNGSSNNMTVTNGSFSGSENGSFSGLFTGAAAERAGMVYNINGGGTYGAISGAVGFQKDATQQAPL